MTMTLNISKIRAQKKISQVDVAKALRMDTSQYSKLEKNGDNIRLITLKAISEVLGVSVIEMLQSDDISVKDNNDNRRDSITNVENNRVALQCATQYVMSLNEDLHGSRVHYFLDDRGVISVAEKFKNWLNEA